MLQFFDLQQIAIPPLENTVFILTFNSQEVANFVLGHSNINTTRIYIITTGAEHKRKMENMRLII